MVTVTKDNYKIGDAVKVTEHFRPFFGETQYKKLLGQTGIILSTYEDYADVLLIKWPEGTFNNNDKPMARIGYADRYDLVFANSDTLNDELDEIFK